MDDRLCTRLVAALPGLALCAALCAPTAHAQDMAPGLAPVAPPPVEASASPAPPPPQVTASAVVQAPPPAPLPRVDVPAPPKKAKKKREPRQREVDLRASVGSVLARSTSIFGVEGALRLRPWRIVAFDLGAGVYGGRTHQPEITYDRRREVPFSFQLNLFLKRTGFLQLYVLTGPFATYMTGRDTNTGQGETTELYLGHTLGLGGELRFGKHLTAFTEIKGFVRARATEEDYWYDDHRQAPDYQELNDEGRPTGRGTNVTGGAVWKVGLALRF